MKATQIIIHLTSQEIAQIKRAQDNADREFSDVSLNVLIADLLSQSGIVLEVNYAIRSLKDN